jgi:hypothetical protein
MFENAVLSAADLEKIDLNFLYNHKNLNTLDTNTQEHNLLNHDLTIGRGDFDR